MMIYDMIEETKILLGKMLKRNFILINWLENMLKHNLNNLRICAIVLISEWLIIWVV